MIVLPVNVDPSDQTFVEWFCQTGDQAPMLVDVSTIEHAAGTENFVPGRWFRGQISKHGCFFDQRSRTIELPGLEHDALVLAASSLCRSLSIRCLFQDYSAKTREFYIVRVVEP